MKASEALTREILCARNGQKAHLRPQEKGAAMMKHRISAFLLAVLLAVTAAGCSAQEPEDSAGLPDSTAGTAVRTAAFYPPEAGYTD